MYILIHIAFWNTQMCGTPIFTDPGGDRGDQERDKLSHIRLAKPFNPKVIHFSSTSSCFLDVSPRQGTHVPTAVVNLDLLRLFSAQTLVSGSHVEPLFCPFRISGRCTLLDSHCLPASRVLIRSEVRVVTL